MTEPSIQETAEALSQLAAGQRLWFWLCLRAPDPYPPLLVSAFSADPGGERLQARYDRIPAPQGSLASLGLGSVREDGRLQLGAPLLSAEMLPALAAWARQHAAAHPGLSRLRGARLVTIDSRGQITASHEDDSLWEGLPQAVVPDTLAHAAQQLAGLQPGAEAWFWLCARGPGDQPFLALSPRQADPDGAQLARRVLALRRRSPAGGDGALRGVLRRDADGALWLTTAQPAEGWQDAIRGVLQAGAALGALRQARLVRLAKDRVASVERLSALGPDLSRQTSALSGLKEGEVAWFWFTESGADGAPALLLSPDRDALRQEARAAQGEGLAVRGQVRPSRQGWLEFITREDAPDLLGALARWAGGHLASWPALGRLRGARMTWRGKDGDVLARRKDDDAWDRWMGGES